MTDAPKDTTPILDDPHMVAVCGSAVDTLEIAAHLEASGLSSRVVQDTFGDADVFGLAARLYVTTPFRAVHATPGVPPMRGRVRDLLRGMLYVVPVLLFSAALPGLGVRLTWWVIPIGLTSSWGLAQATAVFGWALRGRTDDRSDALLAAGSFVVTGAVSSGLAIGAAFCFGGTEVAVAATVAFALYLAMSGVLLLHDREALLAGCLAPGALGVVLSHSGSESLLSPRAGAWTVLVTWGFVVLAANQAAVHRRWHRPEFTRQDCHRAGQYLVHGLCCGTLASAVIGFSAAMHGQGDALSFAVWPLLLSLGLMEWQLRSFRGNGVAALSRTSDLLHFTAEIKHAFWRSFGTYVVFLLVVSDVVLLAVWGQGGLMLPLLLATDGFLGAAFFLALLLESSTRIDLTLRCWAATLGTLACALVATLAIDGHVSAEAGITDCLVASVVGVCALFSATRRALISPLSY